MSVVNVPNAEKVGKFLAGRLKGRTDITGVWARQRGHIAELLVLVDTADLERERAVRRLLWELFDRFPDAYIDLQVTNVSGTEEHMRRYLIPEDAKRVLL